MARAAGTLLVLLASIPLALGVPFCCLVSGGCCSPKPEADPSAEHRIVAEKTASCPHCTHEKPAPPDGPSQDGKACKCKRDMVSHARGRADHPPITAIVVIPAVELPMPSAASSECAARPRPLTSSAPRLHPLLL